MPYDKLDQLYDALKKDGAVSKSREFFKEKMTAPGEEGYKNRKALFEALKADGAITSKDYGEFSMKLGLHAVKNPLHLPGGFGTLDTKDPMAKVRDANEVSDAVRGMESGNAEKAAAGRKKLAGVTDRLEAEKEAAKPAIDLNAPVSEEQRSYMQHAKDAADYQAETGKRMPSVFGEGIEQFGGTDAGDYAKGVASFRAAVPEAERDEYGRITGRVGITSDAGALRADRDARQGAIDARKEKEAADAEKERLSTTEGKDAAIADAESRIREIDAKMAARRRKLGIPNNAGAFNIAMNIAANADEEYNALSAARRQEELRRRSLEDRRYGGNDDYWWQIFRGAQSGVEKFLGFDLASDLAKYRAAGAASGFDKGVDEARQMFLGSLDRNELEQAVAAGSGGLAREFGQLTGNSAIYMLPFMFGGKVIGGIQTLTRAAMRGTVEAAAGQAARKGVAAALGRYTKRALGAVAEDMAIGLTGASTVGLPATLGQAAENYAGKLERDEDGRYYYTGGDDTAHAFVTALLSNSFEYSSEMAGEHMERLWKAGKKLFARTRLGMSIDRLFAPSKDGNRLVRYYNGIKSGAEAWLERLRKTRAGNAAYNAADFVTGGGARMFRHAHIQGLPFEGLEEELNNIENAAFQTGQGSWEDVADNEQRWKLWAGLAISMATTGAVFGGISTVQYGGRMAGQYRAKHLMDRADILAGYRMTEEVWKPIKDGLDNADNADMGTVIAKALGAVKTDEERKEILNYARRLLEYRGYNIATTVGAAQGDGGADAGDMAYSEGYETTDATDMHNIKTRYEEARKKVEADGVNPDETDVRTHIEMMLGARNEDGTPYYTDGEVQPYIDYLNAKAAFDGSLERVRDDIDSGVAESEAAVDRRTGKDGMVHPAVMKQPKADGTERSVYILAGNVEFTGDGGVVIDPKDTRGSIVVCGEDGTMEMVSPDAIRDVGDAIDPEAEKEEAAEAVRQRIAQDAADKFDNTPKYGVNDTFVMTGADGTPVSGVVQRVSADGVEAAVGGRVALIPTEQFEAAVQEVRDAYGNVSWRRTPEDAAEGNVQENGESVPNSGESVQETPENAPQDMIGERKLDMQAEGGKSEAVGRSLSESETETVISEMKSGAQPAPEMELTPENWLSQFGEDGVVATPIGEVKMGENQYFKLAQRGRDGKLGMVKPTLESPDVIVEDSSKAKENDTEERPSSYVFVKTFTKADGSRYYHFTSVTVSKDGGEVVVSNQEKSENRISRLLRNGRIVWIDAAFSLHPTAQDGVSVPLGDSNRLTPTDSQSALLGVSSPEHSASKDINNQPDMQAEGVEKGSALSRIPKDANGEPVYTAADAYTAWDALVEQCGGDADMAQGVADSMVKDMETALKKAEKSAPAHGTTVAEKIAAAKGHKAAVEKARVELGKWRAIAGETASRARAAEEAERRRKKERLDAAREELRRNGRYAKEDAALGDYTDFADFVMRTVATGKYRFLWGDRESGTQGLGAHLGFKGSPSERNRRIWLLSKDGLTPEEAAERMLADYSAAAGFDTVEDTGVDSMDALDVILDVLRRYTSPRAMMDDAKAAHAEQGESAEERRQREEYERGQFMEVYHMTPEEYAEYENGWLPRYLDEAAQVPQEVIDNIIAENAEKYRENGKDNDNGGEDARGVPPVHGERADKPGGDEGGGDTGGAAGAVGEGYAAGGLVPQGASGGIEGDAKPTLGDVIGTLYKKGKETASELFQRSFMDVAETPDFMKRLGMTGAKFTIRYGVIARHFGKDGSHNLTEAEWMQLPAALQKPFAIASLSDREKAYRLYTSLKTEKGEYVVVGVDVKNAGRDMEVNSIATVFGRREGAGLPGNESVIYRSDAITPEQEALLGRPNSDQYPSARELSGRKVTEESADLQENGGKDAVSNARTPLSEQIDAASAEVNTEPTEAQKEAGNYKKGHVQVGTFDVTIEQPQGSVRRGTDANGRKWESKMHNTYGYFRGTEGVDGDHIDVFLSNDIDGWNGRRVYVVDQYNPDGTFDEHKVMLGFNDMDEAKSDYLANYEKGWEVGRRIVVSTTNLEDFEKWIDSSHRKTKPFAEYAGVKKETVASSPAREKTPRFSKVADYSAFAEQYGLDEGDVALYAEGMQKGSSAQAMRALAIIGSKIVAEHEAEIHSLRDVRKFRRPVEKALKETFGDVDKLVEEYRQRTMDERNAMEAARKKAAEDEAKRKRHMEELSLLSDVELDKRYMDAISNGDKAVAREMLDEAARRKGYGDAGSGYQGEGAWKAPSNPGYETDAARRAEAENNPDVNIEDIALGYSMQPDDYFTHPERYSQNTPHGLESAYAIQAALDALKHGEKGVKVKVYRAVPLSVKEGKLRNGDWVTPSRKYAEMHGEHRLGGKYRIIEDEVPANELWWDGNDANEFGYDNGKEYKYKNARNSRKLDDLVTRDDEGGIIPPSKRFNSRKADERYHRPETARKPTPAERVLRDAVIERLRESGMEVITDEAEGQRVLDEANGVRLEAARHRSEESERRNRMWRTVDRATALATGRTEKEARRERQERMHEFKAEAKELYGRVLSGNFDDVTLQLINDYIDNATPDNRYWRPLSKRLPQGVERGMRKGERTGAVDALFSRICESSVPKNGRTRPEAKRRIEEKKKELLKKWAIATGNWHTDVSDFDVAETPAGSGKDSTVYLSADGRSVVKVSKGKDNLRKFRPDIDAVALFNYVFPNSRYEILGYGEVGGKFVKFLRQPFVDFSGSTPLTADERTEYMRKLGFAPGNGEKTVFSNGEIIVADLQGSNIVRDKAGNVRVIDADVKLHTRDMGGDYAYPDVETDTGMPEAVREQRVYHGSGADFDAFDHSHMGEGEGAQSYGWGTYVTEVEGIGRTYAESLGDSKRWDAVQYLQNIIDHRKEDIINDSDYDRFSNNVKSALAEVRRAYNAAKKAGNEGEKQRWQAIMKILNERLTQEGHKKLLENYKEEIAKTEAKIAKLQNDVGIHNLYTVEIPDNNGENYLDWDKPLTDAQKNAVRKGLKKLGVDIADLERRGFSLDDKFSDVYSGLLNYGIRGTKAAKGNAQEATSKFLSSLGFTGIKYPAEYQRGGRGDGAKNYVIFNEKDARITDHVRFFRTENGEAYGFTVGGRIYIDPHIADTETPVHEYAHLWASALRSGNAKEWRNVVGLMKGTPAWDEVRRRYPELETDDEVADEVIATYSGRRGAERLREEAKRITGGNGGVFEKAGAVSALERVKEALKRFWKGVADFLHIHYTSADEVADRVMKDLLDGVDPRKSGKESEELESVNDRFNQRLDELVKDPEQKGKVLHLGRASEFLKRGGMADAEIVLDFDKLARKSKEGYRKEHPFDMSDIKDLPKAIASPIAVFENTNGLNAGKVILTELKKDGRNFIVAVQAVRQNRKGGVVLEVNQIVTLFPKDAKGVVNWFNLGKATNIDKEKALRFIEALQNHSETTIKAEELSSAAKVVENFENPKMSGENVAEEDKTKFRLREMDATEREPLPADEERDAMTDRVNELADRLHTPVRIIRTDEEVAALPSARQRRMKGSFNPMTGEVTVVIPNNANVADVENTVLHEVVGHGGLRVLFPTEEKLDNALDELYRVSKDGIKESIDRMARKMYGAEVDRLMKRRRKEREASGVNADAYYYTDLAEAHVEADSKRGRFRRNAAEEYAADLAGRIGEKGFEKMNAEDLTFWGRLKAVLQNALRKLAEGLGIPGVRKWGDNEWAFVLHEAYKRKRNGGRPSVADAADTVSARESTGFDGMPGYGATVNGRFNEELDNVNRRFNEQLDELTEENANEVRLELGMPDRILKASGIPSKPMVLYGNKIIKKANKHGFAPTDIKNLPKVLQSPIAVFEGSHKDSFAILTEMYIGEKNVLVSIETDKKGELDFNIISSVFGKNNKGVIDWVNKGKLLYADKEKALRYISASAHIADATYKAELDTAANVVRNFENPKVSEEKVSDGGLYRMGDVKSFRDGRGIEFRRKPTATFNALLAHLEKEGVKAERHKARTGSEYASFSRYGVMYEVRNADHTKVMDAYERANESGVEVTDWDGMIRHIDIDLVQARMNAADVYALMDEAERFNREEVRRAATEDGAESAEFRDAYPTLWRVMGLKSPEERMRKEYNEYVHDKVEKLFPFTASNGVTVKNITGKRFTYPESMEGLEWKYKARARDVAANEAKEAVEKVYSLPFEDFARQWTPEDNIEEVNRRFNGQLDELANGVLPKGHVFKLGKPSEFLRAAGIPNLPIELPASQLSFKASSGKHDFDLKEVRDLPKAIANPIATFAYGDRDKAQNILTMLEHDGEKFLVGIFIRPTVKGQVLEVNSIRNVFPKNSGSIVRWILEGKLTNANKKKLLAFLDQQRTNDADVAFVLPEEQAKQGKQEASRNAPDHISSSAPIADATHSQEFLSAAKVVENFENPKVSDGKASDEDLMFRDGDNAEYNKALARDIYERRVSRGLYQTQEALQDSMLGLKEAMDAILKAEGRGRVYIEDVAGFENAYLGENRLSSVNQAECSEFGKRLFKPLLKEAARLAKTAEERAELTDYMMAKHGLERNEVMARRDARKKASEELAKELAKAEKFKKTLARLLKKEGLSDKRRENLERRIREKAAEKGGIKNSLTAKEAAAWYKKRHDFLSALLNSGRLTQGSFDRAVKRLDTLYNAGIEDVYKKDRTDELYAENRKRDYAGLTALTGMPGVADAEDEARRMVADYEREHAVKTLWDRVNAVNATTLLKSYESGMISRETYDDISGMYKNYIPLRGFDEKTGEDAYAYVSSDSQSGFNAPIRTAKGRKSKADDPFANMEAMAESAIMQGNRNVLVKQRFMNFAVNHPSDLVSISDLWLWKNDATGEWQPLTAGGIKGTEAIEEDDTPAEVARKMRDFEAAAEQAAKDDPEHFKRQRENPAIPYRVVESRDLRQHQVIVKRNGRDYVLTVNGNPRAAQAVNGLTNPDVGDKTQLAGLLRGCEKVNRELSAFYTTRNPDFVVSNFLRDMLYANTMVWVKETPNYATRFHMNVLKLNPAMMKLLFAKFRNGTLNDNDETQRMFRQFMMNGGETGYSSVKDIDRRKNDIRRELKKYNGRLPAQRAYELLGERLDEYNRAVENCARFAAFMTSRQMMRSIDRSVYDAKEISVNFNKKGSGARFANATGQTWLGRRAADVSGWGRALFVFFNAAIQGTANYARQFGRHPVKALTGAAVMYLLGTLMAHMGGSGDDDDNNSYWDLPEYTRRSSILFRAGGQWISIPLPVEYRVFYGMGELAVSAIEGREQYTPGELASAVAAQLSQALPIDLLEGGGGLANLMPSIFKPAWEAYTNTSWTGLPIYRDNDFNKDKPNWTKAYRNTNKYLVAAAEKLNEATGGDKYTKGAVDINPALVEYLLNGYFGGVSGTVDKLVKSAETLAGQREYDPRNFLLLNRVVKKVDERTAQSAVNNEYERLKHEYKVLGDRLRGYSHDTNYGIFDFAEKVNFIYNSPEYKEMMVFNSYKKMVDKYGECIKNSASPEVEKEYERLMNETKRDIVERLGKTRYPAARAGAQAGAGAFTKAATEAVM